MDPEGEIAYDYVDEEGSLLFQVIRRPGKTFRQRRPDGRGGWIWNLDRVRRVPFRLPGVGEHIASNSREPIYIVEGEKDVEALESVGAVATCNSGGALKWTDDHSEALKGARRVVIVADRDEPGRRHARAVRDGLASVGVTDVVIVEALAGKDAADHLDAGHVLDDFVELPEPTRTDLTDLTVDEILNANPDMSKDELLAQNPGLRALLAGRESQATSLVRLVLEAGATLFHDAEPRPYMTFEYGGARQTWALRSLLVKHYLRRLYYQTFGAALATQPLADAVAMLDAIATFERDEVEVHLRVAAEGDAVSVDLGDPSWRSVRITADGWMLVDQHVVRFRRARGLAPLPVPDRFGDLRELRYFLNLASEDDWRLVVAWLLAALRPPGSPYPVLVLHGEQGSAKSTAARVLRALIDPSSVPLRAAPRDIRDLMISANAGWVVNLDNLSKLPPWLSDSLCRLSTGGGFATRELYTDEDEMLFDAQRPVILNGIEELATRSDLLDRSLLIHLPTIAPEGRRPEVEFWEAFERARPRILGALYDAVSEALSKVERTRLDHFPRMADFAIWVTAAEGALGWEPQGFMRAYERNRSQGHELALEASVIGQSLRLVAAVGFEGTATELLARLGAIAGEAATSNRDWPKSARGLSGELRRLAPDLRALGYLVGHTREPGSGQRLLRIAAVGPSASSQGSRGREPSQPSQPSQAAASASPAAPSPRESSARLTRLAQPFLTDSFGLVTVVTVVTVLPRLLPTMASSGRT